MTVGLKLLQSLDRLRKWGKFQTRAYGIHGWPLFDMSHLGGVVHVKQVGLAACVSTICILCITANANLMDDATQRGRDYLGNLYISNRVGIMERVPHSINDGALFIVCCRTSACPHLGYGSRLTSRDQRCGYESGDAERIQTHLNFRSDYFTLAPAHNAPGKQTK